MINLKLTRNYLMGLGAAIIILVAILVYVLVINSTSLATQYRRGKPYLLPNSSKLSGSRLQITMPAKFTALPDGSDSTQIFAQKDGPTTTRSIALFAELLNASPTLAQSAALSSINKIVPKVLSIVYYNKSAPNFQKLAYSITQLNTVPKVQAQDLGIKPITQFTMSFKAKASNATPAEIDGYVQYKENKGNNYFVVVSSNSDLWKVDQPTWKKLINNMAVNK